MTTFDVTFQVSGNEDAVARVVRKTLDQIGFDQVRFSMTPRRHQYQPVTEWRDLAGSQSRGSVRSPDDPGARFDLSGSGSDWAEVWLRRPDLRAAMPPLDSFGKGALAWPRVLVQFSVNGTFGQERPAVITMDPGGPWRVRWERPPGTKLGLGAVRAWLDPESPIPEGPVVVIVAGGNHPPEEGR